MVAAAAVKLMFGDEILRLHANHAQEGLGTNLRYVYFTYCDYFE